MRVPCAGWVHPLTVERAIRHGARGVLIVACGPGSAVYREGAKWTQVRMAGEREPSLNFDKVDRKSVRVVELFRTDPARLTREAKAFREGTLGTARRSRAEAWLAGFALAAVLTATMWGASRAWYELPTGRAPELVVSFKHPGRVSENCRDLTEDEKRKTPVHMRPPQICERRRNPVRMRVTVDGRVTASRSYDPAGIWGDGNSLAIERFDVPPGEHHVRVSLGDTANPEEFAFEAERTLEFQPHAIKVVRFDRTTGFEWR